MKGKIGGKGGESKKSGERRGGGREMAKKRFLTKKIWWANRKLSVSMELVLELREDS